MYRPEIKRKKSGAPVLSRKEIDIIGENLVDEFMPEALKTPQEIDIDLFVQDYLGMEQDFQYLSHCGIYLGMTVFNDTDKIPVYNPVDNCAEYISAKAHTVIIDNYAVIFLQDAWEPENSKHNKFSFGFVDETYFNMFVDALQVAKFNNRISAILINVNTRKVVREYNFPCKNFPETTSLFDAPVHQEEEHHKGDFRQMTFFDGFNGEGDE